MSSAKPDWVVSYGGDLDSLGLRYRRVIRSGAEFALAEVARDAPVGIVSPSFPRLLGCGLGCRRGHALARPIRAAGSLARCFGTPRPRPGSSANSFRPAWSGSETRRPRLLACGYSVVSAGSSTVTVTLFDRTAGRSSRPLFSTSLASIVYDPGASARREFVLPLVADVERLL